MKFRIIAATLILLTAQVVIAQQAVIQEVTGTVEVKERDSEEWNAAVPGQRLEKETIISTGFRSAAIIRIGDSLINVRPLTRLSILELVTRDNIETLNVGLQAGRIRTTINPPPESRAAYSVETPVSVSSNRGTVFETTLFTLFVHKGSVEFRGNSGYMVVIDAVGYSYIDEKTGRATPPKELINILLNPALPVGLEYYNTLRSGAFGGTIEVITGIYYE